MRLLEVAVSARVDADMSIVPIYSEFGSRLGDNGGISEVLRDNPRTEYEQRSNSTLAAFLLLILNVIKT